MTRRSTYAWRYGPLTLASGCAPDAESLFRAMTGDLLANGDVEQAMQKAFRWGYQNEDGEDIPGLRDIMQRLRDDRDDLLQSQQDQAHEDALQAGDVDESRGDGLAGDMDVSGRVQQMEELERSLKQVESLDDLQGLDPQLVDSVLEDDEREWMEQWMSMTGHLVEAGLIVEDAKELQLSPEAIRRIGMQALRAMDVSTGREGTGEHQLFRRGNRGPTTDTSSLWEFGRPFSLHLTRTVMNAVSREGTGGKVRLQPGDFEVLDRESTSANATVLLVDMSRSMFHNGCWDAAKRSALALDALMRIQYPRDELEIVGFSSSAERLQLTQLPTLTWDEFSHGTNLQAGLAVARSILRRQYSRNRQVVIITDGEPTAFLENGEVIFENPPTERTFDATLREVVRCTRDGILITTFLLSSSEALESFVERMTRINRGRVIQSAPDRLGRYLVRDFAQHRQSRAG